ncbi:MAG: DUF4920 domain-containing protein [Alphaproteobacteria bacterium]|nr:DUF4920 domain-containing protein [Alphaproteobacteria bacterium]
MTLLLPLALLFACGETDTPDAASPDGSSRGGAPVTASGGHDDHDDHGDMHAGATKPPLVQDAQVSRSGGWQHYGATFTVADGDSISCEQLLADPASHVDQTVRVSGRVADVCQKKGCWMVLTPDNGDAGTQLIRVTMKDHAFGIDMQGTGRQVELEGTLVAKPVDPDTVAHYESEAAKPETIPEKQAQDGVSYELVAHVVRLRNPA